MLSPAAVELGRYDWGSLVCASGFADHVPEAVAGLLAATTRDEAEGYFSLFDNDVVVQGGLFEAAVPLVPVLCAALTEDLPRPAREWVMELLAEIVCGDTRQEEIEAGREGLSERARAHAQAASWLFYRELCQGFADAAGRILPVIENDRERLEAFLAKAARRLDKHS